MVEAIFPAKFFKARNKSVENFNRGNDVCAVILLIGGWTLRNGWLIKSSYVSQNEL
jgi:hypothetical protein